LISSIAPLTIYFDGRWQSCRLSATREQFPVLLLRFQRYTYGTLRSFYTAIDRGSTDAIPVLMDDINVLAFSEASWSGMTRQLSHASFDKRLSLRICLTRAYIWELSLQISQ
jgi:hypothetical protein